MTKKQINALEELLNERHDIAVWTDKKMGNENGRDFLPNNPDYIFYTGILEACGSMGLVWLRKLVNGKAQHLLF